MSVPPPSQPSSTPSSQGENEPGEGRKTGKKQKEFKLPEKRKEEQKEAGAEAELKEVKQQVEQRQQEDIKTSDIKGVEAQASVKAIGRMIQRLVSEMRVGQDMASMRLSATEVPNSFAGSNLTLSYQENALVIHFDNFMTPQQENNAITLIEKNKEQLQEMIQALQSKNITVHEMSIGTHVIALPRAQPLPPPFQPTQPGAAETRQQREQREGEGEEGAGPE